MSLSLLLFSLQMNRKVTLRFSLKESRTERILLLFHSTLSLWGGRETQVHTQVHTQAPHRCVPAAEIPRRETVVNASRRLAFVHVPRLISKPSPYTGVATSLSCFVRKCTENAGFFISMEVDWGGPGPQHLRQVRNRALHWAVSCLRCMGLGWTLRAPHVCQEGGAED